MDGAGKNSDSQEMGRRKQSTEFARKVIEMSEEPKEETINQTEPQDWREWLMQVFLGSH